VGVFPDFAMPMSHDNSFFRCTWEPDARTETDRGLKGASSFNANGSHRKDWFSVSGVFGRLRRAHVAGADTANATEWRYDAIRQFPDRADLERGSIRRYGRMSVRLDIYSRKEKRCASN
jgi:hypothetical protein